MQIGETIPLLQPAWCLCRRILHEQAVSHKNDRHPKGIPRTYQVLKTKDVSEILCKDQRFPSKSSADLTAKELATALNIFPTKAWSDSTKLKMMWTDPSRQDHSYIDFLVRASFCPSGDSKKPWKVTEVSVSEKLRKEGPSVISPDVPYTSEELARIVRRNLDYIQRRGVSSAQIRSTLRDYLPPSKRYVHQATVNFISFPILQFLYLDFHLYIWCEMQTVQS